MLNKKMTALGQTRSVIREIFEYASVRKKEVGAENVFDFSIGNPSVPAPECVNEAIRDLVTNGNSVQLHGYTSAQGALSTRTVIAENLNKKHNIGITPNHIYMTCGAAASLTISIHAVVCDGDEIIAFTPFFPEYKVFVEKSGAKFVPIPSRDGDFQIDIPALENAINQNTKAIIINSPNNPSGVVLTEENVKQTAELLDKKSKEYGHPIYIIADEPYRELVYGDVKVPYIMNFYKNTLVCYSYSKSLSIPGERIGYIAVCPQAEEKDLYAAVCGAGRALGFVCAPSLMQAMVEKCDGATSDISIYKANRDLLCSALCEYGYTVVKPDGAFYLFLKAPNGDSVEFYERAKKYDLLLVPADSFGTPGYMRLAYCVTTEQIERSLPAFRALAESYK